VSVGTLLGQRATIEEAQTSPNRLGQPERIWRVSVEDVPCRLSSPRGEETITDHTLDLLEIRHLLYVPVGIPVTEASRIGHVEDPDGNVIARELDILLVRRPAGLDGRPHHQELLCREVRDAS
jgi:hypothetical protein